MSDFRAALAAARANLANKRTSLASGSSTVSPTQPAPPPTQRPRSRGDSRPSSPSPVPPPTSPGSPVPPAVPPAPPVSVDVPVRVMSPVSDASSPRSMRSSPSLSPRVGGRRRTEPPRLEPAAKEYTFARQGVSSGSRAPSQSLRRGHSAGALEQDGNTGNVGASQMSTRTSRRGSMPASTFQRAQSSMVVTSPSGTQSLPQTVQVGLRVRPLIDEETSTGHVTQAWEVNNPVVRELELDMTKLTPEERADCGLNRDGSYMFEHLFGPNSTNAEVYEQLAQPIVRNVTQGFNGTLFAYGQTSSGKTYTVMGDDENLGLLFLALQDVFDAIAEDPSRVYTLRVQYIEIYNEVVNDLLNPKKTHLRIYEDPKRGPQIRNVTEKTLRDADDAVSVISTGEKNRHISATLMNRQSSRSHTVCRLELTSRSVDAKATGRGSGRNRQTYSVRESMLCVVDLAGSERASKTGATGARLKEASHINKSLMTLGTIISQLSQANNKKHPPFRDSKLTRLLSNALGGNALTALVCCVSPAVRNREETRSTMEFATRAKRIQNRARVNETLTSKELLQKYKGEVEELKEKLASVNEIEAKLEQAKGKETELFSVVEEKTAMLEEEQENSEKLRHRIQHLEAMLGGEHVEPGPATAMAALRARRPKPSSRRFSVAAMSNIGKLAKLRTQRPSLNTVVQEAVIADSGHDGAVAAVAVGAPWATAARAVLDTGLADAVDRGPVGSGLAALSAHQQAERVEEMEEELQSLRAFLVASQRAAQTSQEEAKDAQEEVERLKKELEVKQRRIATSQARSFRLATEASQLHTKEVNLSADKTRLEGRVAKLVEAVNAAQAASREANTRSEDVANRLAQAEARAAADQEESRKEIQRLTDALDAAKKSRAGLEARIKDVSADNVKREREAQASSARATVLEAELTESREDTQRLSQQLEDVQAQLAATKQDLTAAKDGAANLEKEHKLLQSLLDETKQHATETADRLQARTRSAEESLREAKRLSADAQADAKAAAERAEKSAAAEARAQEELGRLREADAERAARLQQAASDLSASSARCAALEKDVAAAKAAADAAEAACTEHKEAAAEAARQRDTAVAESEASAARLKKADAKVAQLSTLITVLRAQLRKATAEVQGGQAAASSLTLKLTEAELTIKRLERGQADAEAAAASAAEATADAEQRVEEREATCESLREERQKLQASIADAGAEVMALSSDLAAARSAEQAASDLAGTRQQEIVELSAELVKLRATTTSQSQSLDAARTELARVQGSLDAANKDNADLHDALKDAVQAKRDRAAEIESLTGDLADARRLLSEWETTSKRHEAGMKAAQEEVESIGKAVAQARRERDRARKEISVLERRLADAQRANAKLKEDSLAALADYETAARDRDTNAKELRAAQQRADDVTAASNGLTVRLRLAEADLTRLQTTLDQLTSEKDSASSSATLNQTRVAQLTSQVAELKTTEASLQLELEAAKDAARVADDARAEVEGEATTLRQELAAAHAKADEAGVQASKAHSECERLQDALLDARTELSAARGTATAATEDLARALQRGKNAEHERARLDATVNELSEELQAAKAVATAAASQRDELQAVLASLQEREKRASTELVSRRDEVTRLRAEVEDLRAREEDLARDAAESSAERGRARAQVLVLEGQVRQAKADVDAMASRLKAAEAEAADRRGAAAKAASDAAAAHSSIVRLKEQLSEVVEREGVRMKQAITDGEAFAEASVVAGSEKQALQLKVQTLTEQLNASRRAEKQVSATLKQTRTELLFAQEALNTAQQQAQVAGVDLGAARADAEADRQTVADMRRDLREAQRRVAQLEWGQDRSAGEKAALEAETTRLLSELEATLASLATARARVVELETQISQSHNQVALMQADASSWVDMRATMESRVSAAEAETTSLRQQLAVAQEQLDVVARSSQQQANRSSAALIRASEEPAGHTLADMGVGLDSLSVGDAWAGSPSNGRIGFSGEPTTPAASPAAAMYQSRLWSGAGMMGTSSSAATAKYEAEITGLRRSIARVERERDEARTRADAARTAVAALESGSERHSATAMAALSNARQSGDEVRRLQVKVSQLEEELRFAKLREADTARSFAEQVHSASRVGATGREAQRTLDATRSKLAKAESRMVELEQMASQFASMLDSVNSNGGVRDATGTPTPADATSPHGHGDASLGDDGDMRVHALPPPRGDGRSDDGEGGGDGGALTADDLASPSAAAAGDSRRGSVRTALFPDSAGRRGSASAAGRSTSTTKAALSRAKEVRSLQRNMGTVREALVEARTNCETLAAQSDQYRREAETLRQRVAELTAQASESATRVAEADAEVDQLRAQMSRFGQIDKQSLAALQLEADESSARVVELEAKLSAEQQRALKAEDALQTAQFQLSDAQADVDRLSRAVATAEGRGEKLAGRAATADDATLKLASAQRELEALKARLAKADADVAEHIELEGQLRASKREADAQLRQARRELAQATGRVRALEVAVERQGVAATAREQELVPKLQAVTTQAAASASAVVDARRERDELVARLSVQAKAHAKQVSLLQDEIDKLTTTTQRARDRASTAEKARDDVRRQLREATAEATATRDQAQADVQEAEREASELRSKLDAVSAQAAADSAEVARLTEELRAAVEAKTAAEEEATSASEALADARAEVETLRDALQLDENRLKQASEAESEHAQSAAAAASAEADAEAKVATAAAQVSAAEDRATRAEARVEELEVALVEAQASEAASKRAADAADSEVARVSAELEQAVASSSSTADELLELRGVLRAKDTQIARLEKRRGQLQAEKQAAVSEARDKQDEIRRLTEAAAASSRAARRSESQVTSLREQLEQQRGRVARLESQLRQAEAKLAAARQQLATAASDHAEAARLRTERDTIAAQRDKALAAQRRAERELAELRNELDSEADAAVASSRILVRELDHIKADFSGFMDSIDVAQGSDSGVEGNGAGAGATVNGRVLRSPPSAGRTYGRLEDDTF